MKLLFYLFPLFFLLQLLSASAEILVAPNAQTVPLGTDAHFFCSGRGSITRWIINNTRIFKDNTDRMFISKGFVFEEEDLLSEQIHNLSMTVEASQMNNNTKIQCGTFLDTPIMSSPVFLTIIGSPVPVPGVRLEVFSATILVFHWDQPFSWENYPILYYNVSLVNTSSGEILRHELYTNTTKYIIHQIPQPEEVCAELVFTITAANAIGESESSIITGGYPIALGPFRTAIQTDVVFTSDRTPVVEILFKPPPVCIYQSANYTIVITDIIDENILAVGPNSYSPSYSGDVISEEITSRSLELDKLYSVAVTVETMAETKTITAEFTLLQVVSLDPPRTFDEGEDIEFTCSVSGTPPPEVTWLKDGVVLSNGDERVTISSNVLGRESQLKITSVIPADSGAYTCMATNLAGVASRVTSVDIIGSESDSNTAAIIGGVMGGGLVLLGVVIVLLILSLIIAVKRHGKSEQTAALYDFVGPPELPPRPPSLTAYGCNVALETNPAASGSIRVERSHQDIEMGENVAYVI